MIKLRLYYIPLILTIIVSVYCSSALYKLHTKDLHSYFSTLPALPAPVAKTITLEFNGFASDYLMLETLSFLGSKLLKKHPVSEREWLAVYLSLKQCVNLDERFFDPYLLAQMTLPFETDMLKETNELLEKAADILTDNYRPHFFLWYNYYYYLNDPLKAGEHLKKAAKIKGAPSYLATLAARMQLYSGKIQAAVIFLQSTLQETEDPEIRNYISDRINAFKKIGYLEHKIQEFRKINQRRPQSLNELVKVGLIPAIPPDPFGGDFYIMENGRVYSTSKLVYKKKL